MEIEIKAFAPLTSGSCDIPDIALKPTLPLINKSNITLQPSQPVLQRIYHFSSSFDV